MALGRSPEYHWNQIISKSIHRFTVQTSFFFAVLALECVSTTFPTRLANGVFAFSFAPFCSVFNKKERLYH